MLGSPGAAAMGLDFTASQRRVDSDESGSPTGDCIVQVFVSAEGLTTGQPTPAETKSLVFLFSWI